MIPTRLVSLPVVDEKSGIRGSIDVEMSEQCATCTRWTAGTSCKAFPAGIPEPILSGRHDHTRPFQGDHGLRFKPVS